MRVSRYSEPWGLNLISTAGYGNGFPLACLLGLFRKSPTKPIFAIAPLDKEA